MPSLPVPLIASLLLAALLIRGLVLRDRPALFLALLAACAAQGAIIALVQHYGVRALHPVQPVTAALIPPLAWLAFAGSALRALTLRDLVHLAVPLAVVACVALRPQLVDAVLLSVFVGYGAAMFWRLRAGADGLPRLALDAGNVPLRLWQAVALALIASGVSDALIVAANAVGLAAWQPWIVTIAVSGNLLVLGVLSGQAPQPPADDPADDPADTPADIPTPEDTEIVARLQDLMTRERLYLDPDLTLTRLSRRLRVPVKPLSGAINRATGMNVSRYINAFRIRAACDQLAAGQSVTEAMLAAGFNTKSNFNREFRRITGQAPGEWRAGQG